MRETFPWRRLFLGLVASFGLTTIACGVPAESDSPRGSSQPTATQPPAETAKVTPASPSPTPVSLPAQRVTSGERLVLVPGRSEARYRAREQLAGRSLPSEAVGSTKELAGTIIIGADGAPVPEQSEVTVDLRSLRSNESRRDNFIQRNTLETQSYPSARFVARETRGLPVPLPAAGEATFQLLGDLTVHGMTRPTTWYVSARFDGGTVTGTAKTTVRLEDFGMARPRVGPVLSIDETLTLELDFHATRESLGG